MNFANPGKQAHIYALLFLGCSLLFASYRWQYSPRVNAADGLARLSEIMKMDAIQEPRPSVHVVRNGATVPELLSRIQKIASEDGVIIRSVTPSPASPDQIAIGAESSFRDLMRFMARLETLQISISSFDIAPREHTGVTATIVVTRMANPGALDSFAGYTEAIATYSAVRNPFEVGDPIPLANTASDHGDVSWTYHLTSISLLGAERVATIDGKDYRVGNSLNGMMITAIGPYTVTLTSPKQAIPQLLHFRRNLGSADGTH